MNHVHDVLVVNGTELVSSPQFYFAFEGGAWGRGYTCKLIFIYGGIPFH